MKGTVHNTFASKADKNGVEWLGNQYSNMKCYTYFLIVYTGIWSGFIFKSSSIWCSRKKNYHRSTHCSIYTLAWGKMSSIQISIWTDICEWYHDVILILQAMVLIISKRFHISVETTREICNNEATKTFIELFTTNS